MQRATTGKKMMKTCHATWDMTAIIPRSCIMAKANSPTIDAMFKSTVLWSVDACEQAKLVSEDSYEVMYPTGSWKLLI